MSDANCVIVINQAYALSYRLETTDGMEYVTKVYTMGKHYSLNKMNNNFSHEIVIELIGGLLLLDRSTITQKYVGPSSKENAKQQSKVHIGCKRSGNVIIIYYTNEMNKLYYTKLLISLFYDKGNVGINIQK